MNICYSIFLSNIIFNKTEKHSAQDRELYYLLHPVTFVTLLVNYSSQVQSLKIRILCFWSPTVMKLIIENHNRLDAADLFGFKHIWIQRVSEEVSFKVYERTRLKDFIYRHSQYYRSTSLHKYATLFKQKKWCFDELQLLKHGPKSQNAFEFFQNGSKMKSYYVNDPLGAKNYLINFFTYEIDFLTS